VQDVARGIGVDKRLGGKFLHAGPGYGGSCFPKDTVALAKIAQDYERPVRLIETTIAINDQRKPAMARKVVAACRGNVRGLTIAILGLTFKPNTDDMREAPLLALIRSLQDRGAEICAYDPHGMDGAKSMTEGVTFAASLYDAAQGADAAVIVTEWDEFRAIDFDRLKAAMRVPLLVDLRNIYSHEEIERFGFVYVSVGRPQHVLQPSEINRAAE